MTEAEWLACEHPTLMLVLLRSNATRRKLRLYACASYRRSWDGRSPHQSCREAVEIAERYADGKSPFAEVKCARRLVTKIYREQLHLAAQDPTPSAVIELAQTGQAHVPLTSSAWNAAHASAVNAYPKEWGILLVREVFGNPFHPVFVAPSLLAWNDGAIRKMAHSIYDDRAFDRLPILADALEDAGCTHADILSHCRGVGEHVPGCWVVDLLLGKS